MDHQQQALGRQAQQDAIPVTGPAGLAGQVAAFRQTLREQDRSTGGLDDEARLALLHELELLTRTAAAVSVRTQVAFHTCQVAAQIQAGVAPSRAGKGVAEDLAVARMTSPYWGSRELTSAKALVAEMPHTLAALTAGTITAYHARVITEATTCLDAGDRAEVDSRLAQKLPGASTKQITATVHALAYQVDPAGFVGRARKAATDRGVSIRPAPDVMGLLSARLPAHRAIACYHALRTHAQTLRAAGDPRTLAQLMADELVARLTGRTIIDGIDIEVGLVITDVTLFAGGTEPAHLEGYGPIPAELARDLLREHTGHGEQAGHGEQTEADGTGEDRDPRPEQQATERPTGGACPDGTRCTSWSCTRVHGHPDNATPSTGAPPHHQVKGQDPSEADQAPGPAAQEHSDHAPAGDDDGQVRDDDRQDNPAQEPTQSPEPSDPGPAQDTPTTQPAPAADRRQARIWLRRLFTDPATGVLTARDTRRRAFTGALRAALIARDRTCRTPWCGAPIRHLDHITRYRDHGPTSPDNAQGLCERCNYGREHPRHLTLPPHSYLPPPPLLPTFTRPNSGTSPPGSSSPPGSGPPGGRTPASEKPPAGKHVPSRRRPPARRRTPSARRPVNSGTSGADPDPPGGDSAR